MPSLRINTSRAGKPVAEVPGGKKTISQTDAMPKPRFLCAPARSRSVWWWRFGGGWLRFHGASVGVVRRGEISGDVM